jgi:uncharacterized membrane protein
MSLSRASVRVGAESPPDETASVRNPDAPDSFSSSDVPDAPGVSPTTVAVLADSTETPSRKLSGRTLVAAAIILVGIPATLAAGIFLLGDRNYYLVSLVIIVLALVPFLMVFERRKPQARELVVVAVMVAIAVAGRAAFFMVPQFKPVVALVIVAGVALGPESGFVVGAMAGFTSNFIFGQGPWTPWQMFAFGIIGFLAGVLFRKGWLSRGRVALSVFGGLTTFLVYGLIMDTSSIFYLVGSAANTTLWGLYLSGAPFNLIHAASTVFFLVVLSKPMIEKLDRVKVKYGLIQPE